MSALRRVLFLGHSYVFFNRLPDLVAELARAAGTPMEVAAVAGGGRTLLSHVRDPRSRQTLAEAGPWDAVVLVEQSLRPLRGRALMHMAARTLDADIRSRGARTVFYGTWARRGQPERQAEIDAAYAAIAAEVGAEVAPIGPAFQRALAERPQAPLFVPDGHHPAPAGSYLAALVLVATLTGASPLGLPVRVVQASNGGPATAVALSDAEAAFLQEIAARTLAACGTHPEGPAAEPPPQDVAADLLADSDLFAGATPTEAAVFLAHAAPEVLPAGSELFVAGRADGTAVVVLDGELSLRCADGSVRHASPRAVAQAGCFGVEALRGEPHAATAILEAESLVVPVRAATLVALEDQAPALVARIRGNVAGCGG